MNSSHTITVIIENVIIGHYLGYLLFFSVIFTLRRSLHPGDGYVNYIVTLTIANRTIVRQQLLLNNLLSGWIFRCWCYTSIEQLLVLSETSLEIQTYHTKVSVIPTLSLWWGFKNNYNDFSMGFCVWFWHYVIIVWLSTLWITDYGQMLQMLFIFG